MIRSRGSLNYFYTLNNLRSLTSIADHIKKCTSLFEIEHVHAYVTKSGSCGDAFLANQFIAAYSKSLSISNAFRAFIQVETSNVFLENAMIRAFVNCGFPFQASQCYVTMLRTDICPTSYTFSPLIRACGSLSSPDFGEAVHGHVWKHGFDSHLYVQTNLLDFYSKTGRIEEARKVFDEMPVRDSFAWTAMISAHIRAGDITSAGFLFEKAPELNTAAWNAMIDGYARIGSVESAELLFHRMPSRDVISWTTMIACYSQTKRYREALSVFKEMIETGIKPDGTTVAAIISVCAHLGALELGKEIHFYAIRNGFELDVYIGSALIDMYAKCGALERSLLVFVKLREKNLFCWNAAIEGLSSHGHVDETLAMFAKMQKHNLRPNAVTFVSVLSACTHAGLVEEGRRRFSSMKNEYSIDPGIEHYGCMVDLLSRAGFLEEALGLIRGMRFEPNAVIWGALLSGCKVHRNLRLGEIAADQLWILEPKDGGWYHLLADLFAGENRWDDVKKMWAKMRELGVDKSCPGSSCIEIERKIHHFSASDTSHPDSNQIYCFSTLLNHQLKLLGCFSDHIAISYD